jgi:hypothetical protein
VRRFASDSAGVAIRLTPAEVAILSRLPSLLGSVGTTPDDPAARRLHPEAYPEDLDASRELARLTSDDLDEARRADLERFGALLPEAATGTSMTADDAVAWMRVLGDARLVVAARRGLLDPGAAEELRSSRDPDVTLIALLGMLQGELSEVLLDQMDERLDGQMDDQLDDS